MSTKITAFAKWRLRRQFTIPVESLLPWRLDNNQSRPFRIHSISSTGWNRQPKNSDTTTDHRKRNIAPCESWLEICSSVLLLPLIGLHNLEGVITRMAIRIKQLSNLLKFIARSRDASIAILKHQWTSDKTPTSACIIHLYSGETEIHTRGN